MATVKTTLQITAAHYPYSTGLAPLARRALMACLLMALTLAGCGKPETVRQSPPQRRDWSSVKPKDPAAANAILMRAIGLVGTPYRWGGNTPESGFDCSGLVNYVFRDMLDVRLPRTSRELAVMQGPKIATNRLTTADLVFFGKGGEVSHVGIYVGEGRFVHAPRTGGTVRLDRLDGAYWRDHYTGAKRVLN
jgi:cell wall-associated NlpC family hydrolase